MRQWRNSERRSVLTYRPGPRVAVIGAGISGLTCARELSVLGYDVVVFEATDALGGRCSSRLTRVGWFDDGAQYINGATRLAGYAEPRANEFAAIHPWTVPAAPADDERFAKDCDKDEEEAGAPRPLNLIGDVGVPTMRALADAIARPLDVRLRTPIQQARRCASRWILHDAVGEIDEDFEALVLAIPASLAVPLAEPSPGLSAALSAVRYSSRWVLLLGTERPVGLPGYYEFHGTSIERIAAMHTKPGRIAKGQQRWFIEAGEHWSSQHAHDDADRVADLLLENFRAHAGRFVLPNYLCAHQWQDALVQTPAVINGQAECLWDEGVRLGVCGDSVVPSQVERVYRSGSALAKIIADGLGQLHMFKPDSTEMRTWRPRATLLPKVRPTTAVNAEVSAALECGEAS